MAFQLRTHTANLLLVSCIMKPHLFGFLSLFMAGVYVHAQLLQSCLTLYNPMDCSLPGSSIHGIFQARILEWVAISSSRGSS